MTKKADTKRPRRSDFIPGRKAVLVRIDERQDQALEAAAIRRRDKRGALRADKSEIVREALDLHPELKGRK